jgi:hypothetical protein
MNRFIKALLICAFVVATIGWFGFDNSSRSAPFSAAELALYKSTSWDDKSADYVGLQGLSRRPVQSFLTHFPCSAWKDWKLEREGYGL